MVCIRKDTIDFVPGSRVAVKKEGWGGGWLLLLKRQRVLRVHRIDQKKKGHHFFIMLCAWRKHQRKMLLLMIVSVCEFGSGCPGVIIIATSCLTHITFMRHDNTGWCSSKTVYELIYNIWESMYLSTYYFPCYFFLLLFFKLVPHVRR